MSKLRSTKHGWYYVKYERYVMCRIVTLPPKRYVPAGNNDGYNEMRELIFQCWYRGVSPSTAVILFRVLNLERIAIK